MKAISHLKIQKLFYLDYKQYIKKNIPLPQDMGRMLLAKDVEKLIRFC